MNTPSRTYGTGEKLLIAALAVAAPTAGPAGCSSLSPFTDTPDEWRTYIAEQETDLGKAEAFRLAKEDLEPAEVKAFVRDSLGRLRDQVMAHELELNDRKEALSKAKDQLSTEEEKGALDDLVLIQQTARSMAKRILGDRDINRAKQKELDALNKNKGLRKETKKAIIVALAGEINLEAQRLKEETVARKAKEAEKAGEEAAQQGVIQAIDEAVGEAEKLKEAAEAANVEF